MSPSPDDREDLDRVILWLRDRIRENPSDADIRLLVTLATADPLVATDAERERLEQLAAAHLRPLRSTRDLIVAGVADRLLRRLESMPSSEPDHFAPEPAESAVERARVEAEQLSYHAWAARHRSRPPGP